MTAKLLTYAEIVHGHFKLNISREQTVALINQLFPENRADAITLWRQLEAQKAYSGTLNES